MANVRKDESLLSLKSLEFLDELLGYCVSNQAVLARWLALALVLTMSGSLKCIGNAFEIRLRRVWLAFELRLTCG